MERFTLKRELVQFAAMSVIQRNLSSALSYWLYGSISSISSKSVLRCRHYVLDGQPLAKCVAAFQEAGIPLPHLTPACKVSTIQYAKALAVLYQQWEQYLPQAGNLHSAMSKGQDYQSWLREGGHNTRYSPVHVLRCLLEQHGIEFFLRAIVHGSIATLDDTPGFSDMDLAFIVRTSVLKAPEKLLRLRDLAREILTLTYAFDPFMHHGPYYISEIDLAWYPEAMFPSVLFGYGVDLLDDSQELEIWTRPSNDVTDQQLDMFEKFFRDWPSNPFILKDSYELEWVLGSAMLLPALYLQRKTGEFRYKRDTFSLAEKDFSPQEWEPIRTASELRNSLGSRPKPPQWVVWFARRLRWPGLLQCWARHHPVSVQRAQEATKVLESDYPQRVLRLLKSMRSKVPREMTNATTAPARKTILHQPEYPPTLRYFDDIPYGPFADIPRAVPKEQYDAAIEMLVTQWSTLSQRPMAIYQIGEISAPGISDLDFVLVFADGKPIDWDQLQPQVLPDWIQELITHPPYCCTREAWPDLLAWFPAFNLRHLWGDTLPMPKIPEEFVSGCTLGMLVDYLIVKVPRDLLWIAWKRPLRVRLLLAMLYSFKHTFKLAEQAGFTIPESALQTISKVDSLRGSWFEADSSERLETLARLCAEICDEVGRLITQVDIRLSQSMDELGNNLQRPTRRRSHADLFDFATFWTYTGAIKSAFENYSHTGQVAWISPRSFSQVFGVYANEFPQLAKYLRIQGCEPKLQWDIGIWNDGLRFHARAMMAYVKSACRLGVPPQKYIALGYSPPPPFWKFIQYNTVRVLKGEISLRKIARRLLSMNAAPGGHLRGTKGTWLPNRGQGRRP